MPKRIIIIISAVLLSIFAGTFPVAIALIGSMHYAEDKQVQRIDEYAAEVIRLTEATKNQLSTIFENQNLRTCPPCSDDSIRKMLELQMSSNLLQSVVAIKNDHILCTSNRISSGQSLGRPNGISPSGTQSWLNVSFDTVPNKTFNIYARDGFGAIVPTDQTVDLYSDQENLSLALALKSPTLLLKHRGEFQQSWLEEYIQTGKAQFKTDTHWVVVKENGNTVGFAALPIRDMQLQLTDIAYIAIPLGLLIGAALSFLVLYMARQRLSLKGDIKAALKREEFFMMYQPVIDLNNGKITGAESLIRWKDTDGNFISPDLFIPIAEQTGLISDITKKVIRLVNDDVKQIWRENPDFHIAINLSSQDMHSNRSVELIQELLEQHSVDKGCLVVEVTERGFVEIEKASSVVNGLHELGVDIAMDDFGTGYSSLAHLESLDLNYLKIDKTFIDTIGTDAATSRVALHIIEMAKSLNLKMIAEGVETERQAELLRQKGVEHAQGWHFGRPMLMNELLELVRQQNMEVVRQKNVMK